MFHSGIAMHQIMLMAALLHIYWNKCLTRNRVSRHEESRPCELIEVLSSNEKDSAVSLKIELDKVNANIHNLYEIIETLKSHVEKIGRK